MIKFAAAFAALTLLFTSVAPTVHAQNLGSQDVVGTWYFFLNLDGQPACQCIEITKFSPDGTLSSPANDHFSGAAAGIWNQPGYHSIAGSLVQNNINADGTAGGLYIIKFTMAIGPSGDQATGTGTTQLVDNTGTVQFSGTFTLKGTKLKLP
jgi:hypothetical protein